MRYPSENTRIKENRGTGVGAEYKSFIQGRDFNSSGTCELVKDWITGRSVELLSQGEALFWYILRFNPLITDIQEQYPLNLSITNELAEICRINHPKGKTCHMTTDFLITYSDGQKEAISFKSSSSVLNNKRTAEKVFLEKIYWENQGIKFSIRFKENVNTIYSHNIRVCSYYANKTDVTDIFSMAKHLVLHHYLSIDDIETKELNFKEITTIYEKEILTLWETIH